jgi:hypothetical protein
MGLVSEAGDGPIKTLYSEIQPMFKNSVEPDTKTVFESKSVQHKKLAKHSSKMAKSERFSKIVSLYAQRMDEDPISWTVGNPECHSHGMTHFEAIADNFVEDIVRCEGKCTNHRPFMAPSTLEARFDRVIQTIAGWGSIVPRTYFDPSIPMSPKKPAALRCDPVLETKNGEKLAKHNDKKSDDENDKKADETNNKKLDGENDKTTGAKIGKKKFNVAKAKGKRKAKKDGKETVEQIELKIIETLIESTQEITDQKDRNKNQTPDAPTEAIIDAEEGKKDEQEYDALGQCTRVISKLDELLRHMQLATEEAHAINTSNAFPDWPLAKTHQVTIELHGVVITTWTKLPENIQQDLLDMNYIKDEVTALEPVVRREVSSIL